MSTYVTAAKDISLEDLGLRHRTYNLLSRHMTTTGEVYLVGRLRIAAIPKFGPESMRDLNDALVAAGLPSLDTLTYCPWCAREVPKEEL